MVSDMSAWEVMSSHDGNWFILAIKALDGIDVTGFRLRVVPIGECELKRALTMGISLRDEAEVSDDDILGRVI
jgi:hypothetical protein